MNRLHLLLPAAALLLTGFASSCNNDDEPSNPNSIIKETEYGEDDTIRPRVIVMSFDKFEDQNSPEVTIANSDTTVLMVSKSFLERNNEAIDDTLALFIDVWDSPKHLPFITKVKDAEDAGDQVKVYVEHAEFTDVIDEGKHDFSFAPYYNPDESSRNSDGTINTDFYVDPSDGMIHPVALFSDEDNSLKKSGQSDTLQTDLSNFYSGMVEDLVSSNFSASPYIPVPIHLGDKLSKQWDLAKGDWGRLYVALGASQLDIDLLFGAHVSLDVSTKWKRKWIFWYPTLHVDEFATGVFGRIQFNADLGLDLKFELEKGYEFPSGSDDDNSVISKPFTLDASKHTAKADQQHASTLIANEINKIKANTSGNYYGFQFPKVPFYHGVFFVGIIPITIGVDLVPEFRYYPPKINANAHLGIKCKYDRSFYAMVGYSDGSHSISLPTKDVVNLHDGWDSYSASTCRDKSLVIGADLTGSMATKFGLYFTTQFSVASVFSGQVGVGPAVEAKCAGAVTGIELDLTNKADPFSDSNASGLNTLNASFGAAVTSGVDCVLDGKINILGLIEVAHFNTSFFLYKFPLLKYMVSTQTGLEYDGTLKQDGGSESKSCSVAIEDRLKSHFALFPENDTLGDEFLASKKLNITIPALSLQSVDMPEVVFSSIPRTYDGFNYRIDNCSQQFTTGGHTVTYTLTDGYVLNEANNFQSTKYYDLSFTLAVSIDGSDYTYKFTTDLASSKSVRVPYAY